MTSQPGVHQQGLAEPQDGGRPPREARGGPKREWWPRGQWLRNDPFPLPQVAVEVRPDDAPRSTMRRWRIRTERQRRVSEAVDTLNYLAASRVNSGTDKARRVRPYGGPPTAVQRSVLESVQERIGFYGDPSSEAVDGERSLREILRSTDQYELEPQHLRRHALTGVQGRHPPGARDRVAAG